MGSMIIKKNPKWFKQGVQHLCQLCSAPRRHVRPTHIPRAPFERRSPIYPNGILCSSMCTSTPPPPAEFYTTSSNFTWQCLFLRVRGHYGRCARSRVRPGQLVGVLAARYHRRGHPHQQFLLQDDLIMDMDQGRRRGCARSRSRPRTRARSLSLASQHDPARLSPTLPTETRALHSKLSPTIFHPHDFTNSTNKGHTINYYYLFIICHHDLLLFRPMRVDVPFAATRMVTTADLRVTNRLTSGGPFSRCASVMQLSL